MQFLTHSVDYLHWTGNGLTDRPVGLQEFAGD